MGFNLINFMHIIPQLLIIIACIHYLRAKTGIEGILLFGGALIGLLIRIFYTVALPYFFKSYAGYTGILLIINVIGLLASIAFAIGFLMLISRLDLKAYLEKDTSDIHSPG